jgi:hypothetical protein
MVLHEAGLSANAKFMAGSKTVLHARQYAMVIAQDDPPPGATPEDALAEIREVLESIGDVCPECLPED